MSPFRRSATLVGKTVAITGAARGIGFATAKALVEGGAHVVIGDIDTEAVGKAAADLGALGVELDVTQKSSFATFLDRTEIEHGPLDVLINNAGVMPTGSFLSYSERLIRRTIDIDLVGAVLGTQLAAERMMRRGRGHVINIASIAGRAPAPGLTIYNAAKFGVIGFSEALNAELEPHGVRISTVQPSHTATELIDGLDHTGIPVATPERVARTVLKAIRTQQLHTYPMPGMGAISLMGPVPGPLKRRILKSRRYRDLFLVADASAREDYDARIARS
ncbi:short-chain alcohol dehydrogenase [Mycobacteroides abscessus subsp. abscessus]|uniref:SDR family NAD(P)-dependent oxidoreductase n=1 Tax=Mycobacteroides abscessus TaxID=36809 RepID=UPI0005E4C7A0|nr:SDR family NAD(P)-dependent oxidoreductase [Mycobacteroides abscessus]MDO3199552.1 SDR family NAD(P)-dependent oxidoreductase [Mycobacteroides abscessus subsp. abscessus]PVB42291.1 KR domain-containing protein [Mycobacteroides abscessus]CPR82082.1 short-chain alcohol dehydrogenase [Mycobacteroides abscessus]CPS33223.1 short-chain alcohol dehydrogenase [Mycobacteroides abscessus]CPY28642.1 short-chain alcohol dehydrogenase [Mycobacteroides abscessus]